MRRYELHYTEHFWYGCPDNSRRCSLSVCKVPTRQVTRDERILSKNLSEGRGRGVKRERERERTSMCVSV